VGGKKRPGERRCLAAEQVDKGGEGPIFDRGHVAATHSNMKPSQEERRLGHKQKSPTNEQSAWRCEVRHTACEESSGSKGGGKERSPIIGSKRGKDSIVGFRAWKKASKSNRGFPRVFTSRKKEERGGGPNRDA